jgi:hypothetical protein
VWCVAGSPCAKNAPSGSRESQRLSLASTLGAILSSAHRSGDSGDDDGRHAHRLRPSRTLVSTRKPTGRGDHGSRVRPTAGAAAACSERDAPSAINSAVITVFRSIARDPRSVDGESTVRALISGAFCGTPPSQSVTDTAFNNATPASSGGHLPTDGTRTAGMCLHCTPSAESAAAPAVAGTLESVTPRNRLTLPPSPHLNRSGYRPPARAPPAG